MCIISEHSALFQAVSGLLCCSLHAVNAALTKKTNLLIAISACVLVHRISYEKRQRHAKNAAGNKLLKIIAQKQSNLAVAADVATIEEMLTIADQVIMPPSHHACIVQLRFCYCYYYGHHQSRVHVCISPATCATHHVKHELLAKLDAMRRVVTAGKPQNENCCGLVAALSCRIVT